LQTPVLVKQYPVVGSDKRRAFIEKVVENAAAAAGGSSGQHPKIHVWIGFAAVASVAYSGSELKGD